MLLALALVAGGGMAEVVRRAGRRVGALAILAGLVAAWMGDRALLQAVPSDVVGDLAPWAAVAVMAAAVGWGAARLPVEPVGGFAPVLPLALASLVGVWAGVPETSAALLTAGVLGGMAAAMFLRPVALSMPGAVLIGILPIGAACIGAVGNAHALVGGGLGSVTFVVLGLGPRIRAVSVSALSGGTAVHLAAALVAARALGVRRDWGGAPLWIALVVALAVVAAGLLRSGQTERP